eukprot:3862735-Heterocapsa_arctica.AAC.1
MLSPFTATTLSGMMTSRKGTEGAKYRGHACRQDPLSSMSHWQSWDSNVRFMQLNCRPGGSFNFSNTHLA